MIGTVLGGRYKIIDRIGDGGMSIVYSALDQRLNRMVAVKILQTDDANEETIRRLDSEAHTIATMNHPNIVSVYDMSSVDNEPHYIVMELVHGITLKEYITQHGVLSWQEVVQFGIRICDALAHAHEKNIIHRDVKPQNMIVTPDGNIKVTDFGIALAGCGTKTKTNSNMGTVHYLSPEQARGGFCNETSDIYSLGVTLYELATGVVPFDGNTPVSIAMKHLEEEPKRPSEINPHISPALESLILKAMQKEQSCRYASALDMKNDLIAILDDPVMKIEIPKIDKPKEEEAEESAQSVEDRRKEKLGVIIGVIVSSVLVLTMLAVLLFTMFGANGASSQYSMPQLIGMTVEEANFAYADMELSIVVARTIANENFDEGVICEQDVDYGTKLTGSKTVYVVVSSGKEKISVSNYVTMDYHDAIEDLKVKKLYYTLKFEENDEFPENVVFEQEPAARSQITDEDTVILYVSTGTESTTVPSVMGYTEEMATKILTDAELIPKSAYAFDENVMEGKVISQNIEPYSAVSKRTAIEIVISKGKNPAKIEEPEDPNNTQSVDTENDEPVISEGEQDISGVVSNNGL